MFDIADHLDELRCWPTDRLRRELDALVGEQRRLRTRSCGVAGADDGQVDSLWMSVASRRTMRTSSRLHLMESLPAVAAAARG
jgi:hypothetical protein